MLLYPSVLVQGAIHGVSVADALSANRDVLDGVEIPLGDGGVVGGGRQAGVAASVLWPGVT